MAKILQFRRTKQEAKVKHVPALEPDEFEDDVNAILNDYTLTPANRRWLLENMLMDIDDQLEEYRRELEKAERKLQRMVTSAEKDIESAYREFDEHVRGMTSAVKKLTRRRSRSREAGDAAGGDSGNQARPKK